MQDQKKSYLASFVIARQIVGDAPTPDNRSGGDQHDRGDYLARLAKWKSDVAAQAKAIRDAAAAAGDTILFGVKSGVGET